MALKKLQIILIFIVGTIVTDAHIKYKKKSLEVACDGESIATVEPRSVVSVESVEFYYCQLPSSYAEALEALYVNVSTVKELYVYLIPMNDQMEASYFKALNIRSLEIWFLKGSVDKPHKPRDDFLMYLTNLTYLSVYNLQLPPFPTDMKLEKVDLFRVKMTKWGGCSKLQELNIYRMDISTLSNDWSKSWLAHCGQLSSLHMENMDPMNEQILERSLRGLTSLVTLKVIKSNLLTLPNDLNIFAGWNQLQHLDFSGNHLTDGKFLPVPSLLHLDLSNNNIRNQDVFAFILNNQPSLLNLSLHINRDLIPCYNDSHQIRHKSLERLQLATTAITELCFEELENLTHLNLRNNNITKIQYNRLPVSRKPLLEVDLQSDAIKIIQFDQQNYESLRNGISKYGFKRGKVKLLVWSFTVGCDCENAWFARALRENLGLSVTEAVCNDLAGTDLSQVPMEQLECDRGMCRGAARNCTCRKRWQSQTVDADCRGADVQVMPRENLMRSIRAPNNRINNLTPDDFPDSLIRVDLSGNRMSQIDPITLEKIFNVTSRRVRLAGNPIICDCEHQSLIEALQLHLEQVEDSDDLKCWGSNQALSTVISAALCVAPPRTWLTALLVAGGVLLALLVLAATLYYRYQYQVKLLLFAYGCLYCVREDDLDADRPYDVFLSFSHGDIDFVLEELLPGLEDGPQGYKVCVHFRDWIVGDWIPAQITRSVEQSRRTIIVLSERYLTSSWGLLEFRTAHEIAMTEGRQRIIVVALDDVVNNDDRLDPELRTYLRNNTYLRLGDKWFWDKLRYALPHRLNDEMPPDQDPGARVGIQLQAIRNCSTVHR